MATKTIRIDDDLDTFLMRTYRSVDDFTSQQDYFNYLLKLGYEEYKKGGTLPLEEEAEPEEEVDDRITLSELHQHIRSAQKGDDSGLFDLASIDVLRIYQKEKDKIEKDFTMDEYTMRMKLLMYIERFYSRYAFLRHIFRQKEIASFPLSTLPLEDETRYHFIYILDNTVNIEVDMEQQQRIKHLFTVYKTIGLTEEEGG